MFHVYSNFGASPRTIDSTRCFLRKNFLKKPGIFYLLIRMHPAAWSSRERKNPLKLKLALEEMGPLAIKLGQLLSTRRDLIPPEVLQQLVLLQDQVKPLIMMSPRCVFRSP